MQAAFCACICCSSKALLQRLQFGLACHTWQEACSSLFGPCCVQATACGAMAISCLDIQIEVMAIVQVWCRARIFKYGVSTFTTFAACFSGCHVGPKGLGTMDSHRPGRQQAQQSLGQRTSNCAVLGSAISCIAMDSTPPAQVCACLHTRIRSAYFTLPTMVSAQMQTNQNALLHDLHL